MTEIKEKLTYQISEQYIKDLSIENPNSPSIFFILLQNKEPTLSINCMVNIMKLNANRFEVILETKVTSKITHEEKELTCFIIEIKYAALTTFKYETDSIDRNTLERILAIDVPNTIWPFIRFIISENIKHSGYQALLLNKIDFEQNYMNSKMKENEDII